MEKLNVKICRGDACSTLLDHEVIRKVRRRMGTKLGESGTRGDFYETECVGDCSKGPALVINDRVHMGINSNNVLKVLKNYLRKKPKKADTK